MYLAQRYAAAAEDMGGVKDQAMRADMDDIDRVGALGLSHENMMLVREKKEEIEKVCITCITTITCTDTMINVGVRSTKFNGEHSAYRRL